MIRDDQLKLIFCCCHPALAPDSQVASTLRTVGGLSTTEIARIFLVAETTMARRITRAKHKVSAAGIPFGLPRDDELADRLDAVLGVVYVVFTAGHQAAATPAGLDPCEEALRLGDVLAGADARRAGGRRAAGDDAAPPRTSGGPGSTTTPGGWCRSRSRFGRVGTATRSSSARGWCPRRRGPVGRGATSCRPRSRPCIAPRRPRATPTGRGSSRSTTSWSRGWTRP